MRRIAVFLKGRDESGGAGMAGCPLLLLVPPVVCGLCSGDGPCQRERWCALLAMPQPARWESCVLGSTCDETRDHQKMGKLDRTGPEIWGCLPAELAAAAACPSFRPKWNSSPFLCPLHMDARRLGGCVWYPTIWTTALEPATSRKGSCFSDCSSQHPPVIIGHWKQLH